MLIYIKLLTVSQFMTQSYQEPVAEPSPVHRDSSVVESQKEPKFDFEGSIFIN